MRIMKSLLAALIVLPLLASAPAAQQGDLGLEIIYPDIGGDFGNRNQIPGNCTNWHEVYPQYCGGYHQIAFSDNGDNVVSDGDEVLLGFGGAGDFLVTIANVVPVIHSDNDSIVCQPIDWEVGSPVCQDWLELYPNKGNVYHVVEWADNGNGIVDACDIIYLDLPHENGETCLFEFHIGMREVGAEVIITTPTEESSWSRIKRFFGVPF